MKYNHENSRAWTGLGLLYHKVGEKVRSKYALTRAQAADPENSYAWAGLAHIAESEDNLETTDLFRHSAELINISSANAHSYHIGIFTYF